MRPVPLLGCFPHLLPDNASQPLVARQSEYIIHSMTFTPAHQLVAAKPGIPSQDDLHFRPHSPDLTDNPFDLCQAPCGGIAVGLPQPCAQDVLATKNI